MDPYRTNKLNQSILEVLSKLLHVSVKDPRVGFVTLNAVKLNRDHSVLTRIHRQKSNLPRCRLHNPCGSCFRPERRDYRKRSCTAMAASCSNK